MANLSAQLSDVNDVSRVVEAPNTPSALATGLNGLASMIDGFAQSSRQAAQAKRQAAADAREATKFSWAVEDHNSANQAAIAKSNLDNLAINGVSTPVYQADVAPIATLPGIPDVPVSDQIQSQVSDATSALQLRQVAVEQRRLSPVALQAYAKKAFNEILSSDPTVGPGALAKAFKEQGIDLFHEYDAEVGDQAAIEKTKREEFDRSYKEGASIVPPEQRATMTDQEVAEAGRIHLRDQALISEKQRDARFGWDANSNQRTVIDWNDEKNRDQIAGGQVERFTAAASPMFDAWLKYSNQGAAPEPGSNPAYETQRAKVEAAITQKLSLIRQQIVNNTLQQYGQAAADSVGKRLDDFIKTTYTDPMNQSRASWTGAATSIGQSFGLRMKETAPLIQTFKSLGVDYSQLPGLMEALDPSVGKRIGDEVRGIVSNGIVDSVEKAHLKNMVDVLKGRLSFNEIDGTAAKRRILRDGSTYVTAMAGKVAAGKGDNEGYLNYMQTIAIGASYVNRQSGAGAIYRATNALIPADAIGAINAAHRDGTTADHAELVGQTQRASAAALYQETHAALVGTLKAEPYQALHYDEANRQWVFRARDIPYNRNRGNANASAAVSAASLPAGVSAASVQRGSGVPSSLPEPSTNAKALLNSLNRQLKFLTNTVAWDSDAPKGTPREIAAFYATGKPTSAMSKESGGRNGKANIMAIGDQILRDAANNPDISLSGDNTDILGPEGTARNPRSTAVGAGQFTNGTWLDTLRKHAPELIQGKSEADILSMRSNNELARRATGWLRSDNAAILESNGIVGDAANTAVAHFLGAADATKLIRLANTDPTAPASSVISSSSIRANPELLGHGETAAETLSRIKRFYGHS